MRSQKKRCSGSKPCVKNRKRDRKTERREDAKMPSTKKNGYVGHVGQEATKVT